MCRGALLKVSQNMLSVSRFQKTAAGFLRYRSLSVLTGARLPAETLKFIRATFDILGHGDRTLIRRDYTRSSVLGLYNSQVLWDNKDPCNPQQEEEEEECTLTPCCRPFRLQKEHPMKNAKKEAAAAAAAKAGANAPAGDKAGANAPAAGKPAANPPAAPTAAVKKPDKKKVEPTPA